MFMSCSQGGGGCQKFQKCVHVVCEWPPVPLRGIKAFCYGAPKICTDFRCEAKKQTVPWHVGLARWVSVLIKYTYYDFTNIQS